MNLIIAAEKNIIAVWHCVSIYICVPVPINVILRFEKNMQAKNCLNVCSGGILHFTELVFSLKNECDQYKALY